MAYEFGTATGFEDLVDKLLLFLTTDATLVGASQQWQILQTLGTHAGQDKTVSLKAPGSGGESDIYVHVIPRFNNSTPYHNLFFAGSAGYEAGQIGGNQPFRTLRYHGMLCWDQPMPYWFFADGRHLKIFVKVSTTYQSAFAGLILPHGTAAEMPYPMYVGATVSSTTVSALTANYTAASYNYASFFDPSRYADFRASDNIWRPVSNRYDSGGNYATDLAGLCVYPWMGALTDPAHPAAVRECFSAGGDGGPTPLIQSALVSDVTQAGPNIHGYLPGVFHVPGFNQAAENIVEIGADDYLIMQSHRWSHRNAFAAIKVE